MAAFEAAILPRGMNEITDVGHWLNIATAFEVIGVVLIVDTAALVAMH